MIYLHQTHRLYTLRDSLFPASFLIIHLYSPLSEFSNCLIVSFYIFAKTKCNLVMMSVLDRHKCSIAKNSIHFCTLAMRKEFCGYDKWTIFSRIWLNKAKTFEYLKPLMIALGILIFTFADPPSCHASFVTSLPLGFHHTTLDLGWPSFLTLMMHFKVLLCPSIGHSFPLYSITSVCTALKELMTVFSFKLVKIFLLYCKRCWRGI